MAVPPASVGSWRGAAPCPAVLPRFSGGRGLRGSDPLGNPFASPGGWAAACRGAVKGALRAGEGCLPALAPQRHGAEGVKAAGSCGAC